METYLEALLELNFCTKPLNFRVKAHMKAPAGDALTEGEENCSPVSPLSRSGGSWGRISLFAVINLFSIFPHEGCPGNGFLRFSAV
jgi:hypothetical protein